jgi:hypothetical protein
MTRAGEAESETLSTGRTVDAAGSAGSRGARGRFQSHRAEADRFWSLVDLPGTDGCWVWRGRTTRDGYGRFDLAAGGEMRAHRYAWQLIHGPLADGLTLDHLVEPDGPCTSTLCVRPSHLEPVTRSENLRRRHARRRAREGR